MEKEIYLSVTEKLALQDLLVNEVLKLAEMANKNKSLKNIIMTDIQELTEIYEKLTVENIY